ncbi:helix-turn-helix transcriptional regulator [Lentzea sp. NPDC058450]|uniref:helix-turn-helix transcriptional regulator n=1 Tax=Lentzea sp. NPDC058450 TaxID=3346505 RepID=UPI0036601925
MRVSTPNRSTFSTTDPDEAHAFIGQMYTARSGKAAAVDKTSPLSLSQISAGGISFVDFTMPPDLTLSLDGTDDLSITTLVSGTTQAELGKNTERYREGDVCLGSFPRGDYLVACRDLRVHIMTVPAAMLTEVASTMPGEVPAPLRFDSLEPLSATAVRQWKRAAAFVHSVLNDDEAASSPLIIGSAGRLLAATALSVFPTRSLDSATLETGATPRTLRKAEEFIHAHAHTDIGLADIAHACHVTPRALQYAFARHHERTPLQYLRHVRLARAHEDLLRADPARGDTVTSIAIRWGFAHAGRFAITYREAYGYSPSQSLRR